MISYQALGKKAGVRGARAVGSAVARNPVALLIPCHRVIRADVSSDYLCQSLER